MENTAQNFVAKLSLINSIEREELLIKKYTEYTTSSRDQEFLELLKEFEETSRGHIALLREKLQALKS